MNTTLLPLERTKGFITDYALIAEIPEEGEAQIISNNLEGGNENSLSQRLLSAAKRIFDRIL